MVRETHFNTVDPIPKAGVLYPPNRLAPTKIFATGDPLRTADVFVQEMPLSAGP